MSLKRASHCKSETIQRYLTSHSRRFLHIHDNKGDNAGCTLWRQYAVMAACRNNKSSQIFYIHGNSTKAREPPWNGLLFCVWNKNVNKDDTCTFFNNFFALNLFFKSEMSSLHLIVKNVMLFKKNLITLDCWNCYYNFNEKITTFLQHHIMYLISLILLNDILK